MLFPMLRRVIAAPAALAHYTVGTVYVLAQLAMYERVVANITPGA